MPLSDDARFVLLAEQILRQAGWRGEPFLGVKLQDPTWTRARWEQAQAELTLWRLQQVQARRRGSGLEPLGAPWADGEDTAVVFSLWRYAVREAHNTLFERRENRCVMLVSPLSEHDRYKHARCPLLHLWEVRASRMPGVNKWQNPSQTSTAGSPGPVVRRGHEDKAREEG